MCQLAAFLMGGIRSLFRLRHAFFLFLALLLTFAQPSIDAQIPSGNVKETHTVWVATQDGLVKLDPVTCAPILAIPDSKKIDALAIDFRDLTLWGLGKGILTKYDFAGTQLLRTVLAVSGDDDEANTKKAILGVNQSDGLLWLGLHKKLFRYDATGDLHGTISLAATIKSISFDDANSRTWIATEKSIDAYNAQGVFLGSLPLGKNPKIRAMVFDNNARQLWVASGEKLAAYTADGAFVA